MQPSPRTALLLVLASLVAPAAIVAQTKLFTVSGDSPGDLLGYSHRGLGDVDGDGHGDFAVGVREDDDTGTNAGAVRVFSGLTGRTWFTAFGQGAGDQFGSAVGAVGDVNQDGVPDLVVGAPKYDYNPVQGAGYAQVLSGKDGAVLYTFPGDADRDGFGLSVDGAGDVDRDGWPDVIVGAPQYQRPISNGYARVFSGRDGHRIYEWRGAAPGDVLGFSVAGAGDVNGDGFDDVVVGAPGSDVTGNLSGQVMVFSGRTGAALFVLNGTQADQGFGISVAGGQDVDADGFSDFCVGGFGDDTNGINAGAVWVFSGLSAAAIHVFHGDQTLDYFGISTALTGDLDRDGYPDIVAGSHNDSTHLHSSYARAFSGKDGTTLLTLTSGRPFDHFGFSVSSAGDVNNDGFAEFIVGAHTDWANSRVSSGSAHVYTARTMPLAGGTHLLSLSAGGTHTLTLEGGAANAGSTYVVLGSASGVSPGLAVGGVTLPLNWDGYLAHTLAYPNTAPLSASLGVLDGSGRAQAAFSLPAGSPGVLAGLGLQHAYLLGNAARITFASNPVPLNLVMVQ